MYDTSEARMYGRQMPMARLYRRKKGRPDTLEGWASFRDKWLKPIAHVAAAVMTGGASIGASAAILKAEAEKKAMKAAEAEQQAILNSIPPANLPSVPGASIPGPVVAPLTPMAPMQPSIMIGGMSVSPVTLALGATALILLLRQTGRR